jgi:hypothetical protein
VDPFTALIIYAVLFVAAELLRPKPDIENAKAATFEEFGIPSTDPKRPISIVWGRTRVTGPGIVWYGDYRTIAIEEEVKTGLFSKKSVTTGYIYNIGVQLGIARAVDAFEAFDWDDERLVTFSPELVPPSTIGVQLLIDEPDFLGGEEGASAGGGIQGFFRFYRGSINQTTSGYLSQFQTPVTPAYKHLAMVIYEGPQIGTQPRISAPAFIVNRYPNGLGLTAGREKVGSGANPMNVIFELMTDDDFGVTIDVADINVTNFTTIANQLFDELHGYSNTWAQKSEAKAVIDDILRQIDATLFMEYTTGQFEVRLVRDPNIVSPFVPLILNESNVVELTSFRRVNWSETTNRIVVNWKDPEIAQTPSPAVQDDMANQRIQARNVVATFNHPGIDNPLLAAQVAAREIRANSFPLAIVSLVANRDAIDLRPGDVFELQWDELGISTMIMRVLAVAIGSDINIRIRIDCAQDVYSLGNTIYAEPGASLWFNPASIEPLASKADDVFEAPLLLDRSSPVVSPTTPDTEDFSRIVLLPVPNQSNVISFRMMFAGPGSPAVTNGQVGDFPQMCPSGVLVNAISLQDFIDPLSPNTMLLSGFNNFRDLRTATAADIVDLLANLFRIGDEFFSFETTILNSDGTVTLTGIHRAKLDSLPAPHGVSPDSRVFFMGLNTQFAGGISDQRWSNGRSGAVSARTNTTRGRLSVGAATVRSFTSTARVRRPYPPKNLEIEVPAVSSESPAIANSPALPAAFYPNRLNLPRGDFIFTWDNRNRTALNDQDYDTVTSQALEASTEIVFEFRNPNRSPELQRTVLSTAETLTYPVSQQDADLGGPGSPELSPAVQTLVVDIFTRRTDSPALESEQRYTFTIQRTI